MSEKILASLPGRIASIAVKEGEKVSADSLILVIEAMKMENEIFCEHGGSVRQILVKAGDTVNVGDVVVVLE